MKAIVDVQYIDNTAYVAMGLFEEWSSDTFAKVIVDKIENVADYEPGSFYKRELPCILSVLGGVTVKLEYIVIDGFVQLSDKKMGLGMHLYNALDKNIKIIGIAKTKFQGSENVVRKLVRGNLASNPLFITSVGISLDEAEKIVRDMHGKARIPTLASAIDRHARDFSRGIK